MKITIIANPFLFLPPKAIGAVEILWYDVAKELAKCGQEVAVIGRGDPAYASESEANGFRCQRERGYNASGSMLWNLLLTAIFDFKILLRMAKCDILVVNNFWGPIIPAIFFRWKYRRLVYNAQRMPKGFFRFYGLLDGICCPSSSVSKAAEKVLPRKMVGKMATVPNPIDVQHFNGEVKSRITPHKGFLIGYHGRIHPEKGLHILVSAVKSLSTDFPEMRLRLIGTYDVAKGGGGDAYKNELDKISNGLIEWREPIADRKKLAEAIAECDLYCYPSIAETGETFGVSPLEAMGVGVPVVVSALSCFTDFVKDGETGLVFDHRASDPVHELKEKLRMLLMSDEIRCRLSASAAKCAAEFSNENVARQYQKWFEELSAS